MPNQIIPDQKLIELLKANDERAISLIFKEHYPFLCQVIIRVVKDPIVAEDLAQDVFHDLWKRRENLEISTSIKAYLRRAGVNKTLNYIRDKKVKWDDEDKLPMVASTDTTAIQHLEGKELEELINLTIDSLPDRCRLVFTLSRFEDLSYQEIATSLDISVKTVENQMSKALKVLRGALKGR
ncbi:MAG: RNA polymerase sigma-70 factor [Saprospiraceae bacterium]